MKCLEQDEYELCARLTTQMEVDDLCFRMGEMILVKKDSGREAFALKYLKELEKKRSQIVERVWDKKLIAFFVLTPRMTQRNNAQAVARPVSGRFNFRNFSRL